MSQPSTKQDPKTDEKPTCQICGKTLTRQQSIDNEIGHRCEALIEAGWTGEKLQKHQAAQTGAIPADYVKVADLHRLIERKASSVPGLTISKMVKAIGKDRAVEPPLHAIAKPIYDYRRTRWVNPWLASADGLTAIATGDFAKAPSK